jgi:Ribbon-helix-helix protein, copG family
MNGTKVTTMRLPEGMAAQLAAIARTEGVPVSEFVRLAIEERITSTLLGEGFKERMKRRMDEDREVLRDLGIEDE